MTRCFFAATSLQAGLQIVRRARRFAKCKTRLINELWLIANCFFMDSSEQLQRIYLAGFELQTFERYPNAIGVIRDNCIALLRATPSGLQMIGAPGWRMGEVLGVQVEKEGREVFQAKSEVVEATPERLDALRRFKADLEQLLTATA